MLNHIKNKLRFNGSQEAVISVMNFIKNGDRAIDFRKIVPRPATLMIESSSNQTAGIEYLKCLRKGLSKSVALASTFGVAIETKHERKCIRLGRIANYNEEKYGFTDWYGWCRDNWGTEWNAYDDCEYDGCIEFTTAWSGVPYLMRKLSEKFPDIIIDYSFADEDYGYNACEYSFAGGIVTRHIEHNKGTQEDIDFSRQLWGEDYDEQP